MENSAPLSLGCWQPLSPHEVAALFAPQPTPWWIAGGWALDLFLGSQTRVHDDIDVQILRPDQRYFRAALRDWDVRGALPPPRPDHCPFKAWRHDEGLDPAIHDIWCRPCPHCDAPSTGQLMVGESEGDEWIFRRDPRIRRALEPSDAGRMQAFPTWRPRSRCSIRRRPRGPRTRPTSRGSRRTSMTTVATGCGTPLPWCTPATGAERPDEELDLYPCGDTSHPLRADGYSHQAYVV